MVLSLIKKDEWTEDQCLAYSKDIYLLIFTTFDFCFISREYLCGMWSTTAFWRCWKLGKCLQITLLTKTAHLLVRFSRTSGPGNILLREKSFKLCCGVAVGRHSEILFRIAYCWVQWIDLLRLDSLCILECISKSMLSPTSLQSQNIYYLYFTVIF